jgi:flagellar motor switch/type III secretory pathway protein FliN
VIRPFDLESLPSVSAREAALARSAAWALGALPSFAEVTLPHLGDVALRYVGLAEGQDAVKGCVSFGLSRTKGAGRLHVPIALAHEVLAATLRSDESPSLPRRLGMGERGLLGGLVAAVLHQLGSGLSLSLDSASPVNGAFRLAVEVSTAAGAGVVVLEAPAAWLRRATDEERWRGRARALSATAALELARTNVPRDALAAVEQGDAVVFDGFAHVESVGGGSWRVDLTFGDHQAQSVCSAAGAITVVRPFRRTRSASVLQIRPAKENTMDSTVTSIDGAAVLAAAPIEVVAELGRLTLRGEEVLALAPGTVITLQTPRPTVVSLRVGAEIWAEGELVNVEGELGVRVTSLRRSLSAAGG